MTSRLFDQRSSKRVGVQRELLLFYGVAALTLVLLAVGAVAASRSVARSQALDDAERMTTRLAELVIGPLLDDVVAKKPEALDALNEAVKHRMQDGYLTEVTVWNADGTIFYADDPRVIGEKYEVPAAVRAALDGHTTSAFEDQPEATVDDPNREDIYVEVYVPFQRAGQPNRVFEAYYDYASVEDLSDRLFRQITPLVLVPLILLQLIQLPIAASLARRVRTNEAERARLLERTLSVSERERIRIAADLHDGPIQDLAGVGYALGAVAPGVAEQHQGLLATLQETLYRATHSLRVLMVDLYPPDLSSSQLPAVVHGLTETLRGQGVEVVTHLDPLPELDQETSTTIYRVTRETLANIDKHAEATQVTIDLRLNTEHAGDHYILLTIADNGVGIDMDRIDRRAEGHLGLRLLQDRVESLGGTMTIGSRSPTGTAVETRIPIP